MCDQKYGRPNVARAPATARNDAASREKNQIAGPAGPITYVRKFISGKVMPSAWGRSGGRRFLRRKGVRLIQALPSNVSVTSPCGKHGWSSSGSHDQWKKLISCQR